MWLLKPCHTIHVAAQASKCRFPYRNPNPERNPNSLNLDLGPEARANIHLYPSCTLSPALAPALALTLAAP